MAEENNRIHQIISNLSSAASVAADGVSDAVQNAGNVVSEKYGTFKTNIELSRLQDEQEGLFSDIGRIMFTLQSGEPSEPEDKTEMVDAQQEIDRLLLLADQKQQEIDLCAKRIFQNSGNVVCPGCKKVCSGKDDYCPRCGTKLPKQD